MPTVRVNFSQAKSQGREDFSVPLPAGWYAASVRDVLTGVSQAGNPKLEFEFKFDDYNRRAWRSYALVDNALWSLQALLREFGWSEEQLKADLDLDPTTLLNKKVWLLIGIRTYMGKEQNEILDIRSRVEGSSAPATPAAASGNGRQSALAEASPDAVAASAGARKAGF